MKKFFIIFALFFALVSCQNKTETPENISEKTNTGTAVVEEKFDEIIQKSSQKITQSTEFNACMTPYVNMCLENSASEMAKTQKNSDMCNELSGEERQNSCRFGVVLSEMYEHKDPSRCDVLTDDNFKKICKSSIIEAVAIEEKNLDKCDEVGKIFADNEEESKEKKNSCMYNILLNQGKINPQDCDIFTLETYTNACRSIISF